MGRRRRGSEGWDIDVEEIEVMAGVWVGIGVGWELFRDGF